MNIELRYIEVSTETIAKMREYSDAIDNLRGVKAPDILKEISRTIGTVDYRNGRLYEYLPLNGNTEIANTIGQIQRAMEWAESSYDMKSFLNMTMKQYVAAFSKQWGQ